MSQSLFLNISTPVNFDPSALSGLVGWWNADNVTLNGGTVSGMTDLSGLGKHLTQTNAAAQPTHNATGLNGHGTMTFSSIHGLGVTGRNLTPNIVNSVHYYTVYKSTSTGYSHYVFGQNNGIYNWMYTSHYSTLGMLTAKKGAFNRQNSGGTTVTNNVWHTHESIWEVYTSYPMRNAIDNGVVVNQSAAGGYGSIGWVSIGIGGLYNSGAITKGFVGDIAECIAYNRILTTQERSDLHSYVNARYAI